MFYLIVAGSRTFQDYTTLSEKLDRLLTNQTDVTIITGGARGCDSLAERYAKEHNYPLKVFPADWSKGKSAGYIRNKQMHAFAAQYPDRGCVCFWDGHSRGTTHSFDLAKRYNTPLRIIQFQ